MKRMYHTWGHTFQNLSGESGLGLRCCSRCGRIEHLEGNRKDGIRWIFNPAYPSGEVDDETGVPICLYPPVIGIVNKKGELTE